MPDASALAVLDNAPVHLWMADAEGGLTYINTAAMRFFGGRMEDLLGSEWANAVHPQDVIEAGARWSDAIASGEPYEQIFRLRRGEDDRYFWFLARANAVRAAAGTVLHWVGVNTEIDAVMLAQHTLRSQVYAQHVQVDLFERMPVGVIVVKGARLQVEQANAAARRFASGGDALQRPLAQAFPALVEDRVASVLQEAWVLGEARRVPSVTLSSDEGDGPHTLEVLCHPLHAVEGGIEGMLVLLLPMD